MIHLHHVHLFSHDLSAAIDWYKRALSAEVYYDGDFGGSRNVFMKVGSGRIHLYSQAPRHKGSGAVHHIGIRTDDLAGLHTRLIEMGGNIQKRSPRVWNVALYHVSRARRCPPRAFRDRHGLNAC